LAFAGWQKAQFVPTGARNGRPAEWPLETAAAAATAQTWHNAAQNPTPGPPNGAGENAGFQGCLGRIKKNIWS